MKGIIRKIIVKNTTSVKDTIEAINRGALGIALIVDEEDKFCGLVTDGDIRRAVLKSYTLEDRIEKIMEKNPITAKITTPFSTIFQMMSEKIRHIPILDKDNRIVDLASYMHRFNLPIAEPALGELELRNITECIVNNMVSSIGKFVTEFEEIFAKFCGTRYAIATSNGTAALHLALATLGIGPGDEVIVPTLTFIATANAVTYTGAKPVFVDSEPKTWNIDAEKIEQAITDRTRAIMPVHLYGHPADMDQILEIAKRHHLYIIEDAAEAHGAIYKDRKVGSIGDMGCFSFFGNKVITTGEGGMITTNNEDFVQRAKLLRNHGMSWHKKYWHEVVGFNYRLTNIQAAIGVAQLRKIDEILKKKRMIAAWYNSFLADVQDIIRPPEADWAKNIFWMYSILVNDEYGMDRNELMDKLRGNGIECRPIFYPIHTMPPYKQDKAFPVAEQISRRGISLPSGVNLTKEEVERITNIIKMSYIKILV